jgi:D-alanyl-D-alanine carboxypeptidase/D-alanyl-D-alanine-endopeptidase (penicillin-binding protein 4)
MVNYSLSKTIKKSFPLIIIVSLTFILLGKDKIYAQENINNSICQENIDQAIASVINRPEYIKSSWGIMVKELNSQEIMYNLNGEKYFYPASNVKLLTTAAVLLKLEANYRFQTPIFITQNDNNTTIRLIGQGDPSLTDQDLETVAEKLQQENITNINKLIVEENNNLGINPSWEWEDIHYYYGVKVNSLILNENTVTLKITPETLGENVNLNWSDNIAQNQWDVRNTATTSAENTPYNISLNGILGQSILEIKGEMAINSNEDLWRLSILNPSQYFLDKFNFILEKKQIAINQKLVNNFISPESENERLLTTIESDPLSEIVFKANQQSNNLYAEALLQLLGNQSNPENNNLDRINHSLEVLKNTLTQLGVEADSYKLKDGSGLSRHNLVSPQSLVKLLDLMTTTSVAEIYQNSLPIAGVSGTLRNRFTDNILTNNLKGKTGTASGVSALSGYLTTEENENLVFSIMVSNSEQSGSTLRKGIDEIALIFAQVIDCN